MRFANFPERDEAGWSHEELVAFLDDPRLSTMCDLLPDGLVLVDRGGVVRFINAAAESMSELPRAQVIGRPLADFVAESVIQCPGVLDAFTNGKRFTENLVEAGGRRMVVSGRVLRDSRGTMTCFLLQQRNLDAYLRDAPPGLGDVAKGGTEALTDAPVVGVTEESAKLLNVGQRAMSMGSRVLLLGESGVGKTEFAKLLHRRSGREASPFVHVNCAGIPESLFESEMFGYERGSFTGALSRGKVGLIEAADGGTLFLDEIGETPLQSQAKLLQVLESGTVQRVGATKPRQVKVNVVAATNQNLRELVEQGRFRRDLYYRLSVVVLSLPPLRKQRDLIEPLLERFLAMINARRETPLELSSCCRKYLKSYDFPGNIRELQNMVEYLSVVCEDLATERDLPDAMREEVSTKDFDFVTDSLEEDSPVEEDDVGLKALVRRYESKIIEEAIRKCGSKRKAAALLHTDIATISRKSKPSATVDV